MAAKCIDVPAEEFLSLPDAWRPVHPAPSALCPPERSKFAVALCGSTGALYVCGGRSGRQGLRDLWRYSPPHGTWERLEVSACSEPPPLEGHSMVEHKGQLYVFGGTFGYPDACETPLWIYSLEFQLCRQWLPHGEVAVPSSRRGHTAVVHRDAMVVFGGFVDLRGSVAELWSFDFVSECWHLAWSPTTHNEAGPSPRHSHSAVVHDGAMWLFGGLNDLQAKSDFWKWSFRIGQWTRLRFNRGPSPSFHHTGCIVDNQLLVLGTNDTACSSSASSPPRISVWAFSFDFFCWRELTDAIPTSSWGHFCAGQTLEMLTFPLFLSKRTALAPPSLLFPPPPSSLSASPSLSHSSLPATSEDPASCILEDIELCSETELFQAAPEHSDWAFRNPALSVSSCSEPGDSGVDLRTPSQPSAISLRSEEEAEEEEEAAAIVSGPWKRQLIRFGCCRRRTPVQAMTLWIADLPSLH